MYSCGSPHMDVQEWDDQHELTYSSYVRTRDVTLKTCRRRWLIGRNGERRSGISAQTARHDDDDDDRCKLNICCRCPIIRKTVTKKIQGWHQQSIHHHHHHHVVLVARISLTLSCHFSLSFIASGRSSGQHPVSSNSCWMYVPAGRPDFARP